MEENNNALDIFGGDDAMKQAIMAHANELGVECEIYQSNHEGAIIDKLHESRKDCAGVVFNGNRHRKVYLSVSVG